MIPSEFEPYTNLLKRHLLRTGEGLDIREMGWYVWERGNDTFTHGSAYAMGLLFPELREESPDGKMYTPIGLDDLESMLSKGDSDFILFKPGSYNPFKKTKTELTYQQGTRLVDYHRITHELEEKYPPAEHPGVDTHALVSVPHETLAEEHKKVHQALSDLLSVGSGSAKE